MDKTEGPPEETLSKRVFHPSLSCSKGSHLTPSYPVRIRQGEERGWGSAQQSRI